MHHQLSRWLQRISTGSVVLVALVIFLLFTALVLPGQSSNADQGADDHRQHPGLGAHRGKPDETEYGRQLDESENPEPAIDPDFDDEQTAEHAPDEQRRGEDPARAPGAARATGTRMRWTSPPNQSKPISAGVICT